MSETMPPIAAAAAPEAGPKLIATQHLPRDWQHLALVLWAAFSMPLLGSISYLLGGETARTPMGQVWRLCGGLISEVTGLWVLRYVMVRQGRSWRDLGWKISLRDVPSALGLLIATAVATWGTRMLVWLVCVASSLRLPAVRPPDMVFGFGVSALSIVFVCLNPFFEELIARAYIITEVLSLGGGRARALAVSVIVQLSYHLYQGPMNVLSLAACFTILSAYYLRSRKILPVILVHLAMDLYALLSGRF